mmetsp:Transcript_11001/g.32681  ORF Transcript_11001/g.32681 Transcript_11001/m.32681 type:complete len:296 (-) Transcript_11001:13-900(-)
MDSMWRFTSARGTLRDSEGAETAVPSRRRSAASRSTPSASSRARSLIFTLSGGGSRMKVGVRQPSSTASARKCASILSAEGQSSTRSSADSSSVMNASKTWLEEMMRRTWREEMSTATISRSRLVRSKERMMDRRTSWSCWRGMRSSSSWRMTSMTSAESKYSRIMSATLALNSSTVAGGCVCRRLLAVKVFLFSSALMTSGGKGSGSRPFHAITYLVPFSPGGSPATGADGRLSAAPSTAAPSRNLARGMGLLAAMVDMMGTGGALDARPRSPGPAADVGSSGVSKKAEELLPI